LSHSGQRVARELIGNPSDQHLISYSPSQSIETIRATILLIHAANDTVEPPSQSRNFAELLKRKGKHYLLIGLPGKITGYRPAPRD
jgi:dipeptidyl aminopeptidase/acylaminoacyl peptidase